MLRNHQPSEGEEEMKPKNKELTDEDIMRLRSAGLPKELTRLCLHIANKEKQSGIQQGEKQAIERVKEVFYGKVDWIKVFKDAYENRKTSWYEIGHIKEWRNATDEVLFAIWHQIEQQITSPAKEETFHGR